MDLKNNIKIEITLTDEDKVVKGSVTTDRLNELYKNMNLNGVDLLFGRLLKEITNQQEVEPKKTILELLTLINADNVGDADYREIFTETIFPKLLNCKEFANVKASEVINTPTYIDSYNVLNNSFLNEKHLTVKQVSDYRFNPNEEEIEFNDYVQIYDVRILEKNYKSEDLPNGLWLYPTKYDEFTFLPKYKLEINYDLAVLQSIVESGYKEDLVNEIFSLIEKRESNIPFDQIIIIRCSPESIKSITKKKRN